MVGLGKPLGASARLAALFRPDDIAGVIRPDRWLESSLGGSAGVLVVVRKRGMQEPGIVGGHEKNCYQEQEVGMVLCAGGCVLSAVVSRVAETHIVR